MVVNPTLWRMREVVRTPYGDRLFRARKEHAKISQATLAAAAGTTQSNVAELELTGQGSSYTAQFAKRLNVRAEWLAEGTGDMIERADGEARPNASPPYVGEPGTSYALAVAVQTVAKAIEAADSDAREDVLAMLTLFVKNPTANAGQLPLLVERLSGGVGLPKSFRTQQQA